MTQSKAKVEIVGKEILSDGWTKLTGYRIDYTDRNGVTHRLPREVYHRTPAACILLYDPKRDVVVLVKQFRLPAYVNGDPAWMIEVPAGLLDGDEPEAAIRREAMEETGYTVRDVRFLFKSYPAPGSITEVVISLPRRSISTIAHPTAVVSRKSTRTSRYWKFRCRKLLRWSKGERSSISRRSRCCNGYC